MKTRPCPTAGGTAKGGTESSKACSHRESTASDTTHKHADLNPNKHCATLYPAILTESSTLSHVHVHLQRVGVPDPSAVPLPASR